MADIDISLNLSDNGSISKRVKDAQELNHELDKQSRIINKLRSPKASYRQAMGDDEMSEYGVARGAVGTGAAGRDFAKQAQGLGGLVHVYATFAANLFAVSAAFRALSEAADTTNMVKGIEQLGAASGTPLSSVAKQLVKVTDSAISMREAMEAATKGGAAGLSSEQMIRMGEVAKKASQALGISMTDALSRLSRGISKLEPELLDELGIYTKLEKATQDYARTIGKSATALTDFERRQAFANAVLKEGTDKFSNIQIDSNPYDKLLASIKNIGQAGLELVNKVLGPIAKYLAESPTALTGALTMVGLSLMRMAVPAFAALRENAAKAAEETRATASRLAKEARDAADANLHQARTIANQKAQAEIAAAEKAIDTIRVKADQALKSKKGTLYQITQKDPQSIDTQDIAKLTAEATKRATQGREQESKAILDTIDAIEKAKIAKKNEAAELDRIAKEELRNASALSIVKQQQMIADQAASKARRSELMSMALENVQTVGLASSYKMLAKQLDAAAATGEISKAAATWTKFTGAISLTISRLTIFANAYSGVMAIVAAAVGAFSLLDSVLSKNAKEIVDFNLALERTHDAGQLVANVMKSINESTKGWITVENVQARANAFEELAVSVGKSVSALNFADTRANWWDKFIDGWKVPFGKDLKSSFSKELAFAISEGIEAIPDQEARKELEKKLKDILGTSSLSYGSILAAASKIPDEDIVGKGRQIEAAMKKSSQSMSEAGKNLKQLNEQFTTLQTTYQNLVVSLNLSDPYSKFGSELIKTGIDMGKVFESPISALAQLKTLLSDTSKLSLLPKESIDRVLSLKVAVDNADDAINLYKRQVAEAKKEYTDLINELKGQYTPGNMRVKQAQEKVDTAQQRLTAATTNLSDLQKEGAKLQTEAISRGIQLLERGIVSAQRSANVIVGQALMANVDSVAAAKERGRLALEELAIQRENIMATVNLTDAIMSNTLALEKDSAIRERDKLAMQIQADGGGSPEDQLKLKNLNKLIDDLTVVSGMLRPVSTAAPANKYAGLSPNAAAMAARIDEQRIGQQAALAGIKGKERVAKLTTELDINQVMLNIAQKNVKANQDLVTVDKQRIDLIQSFLPYLSDAQLKAKADYEDQIAAATIQTKRNEIFKVEDDLRTKINNASGQQKQILLDQLAAQQKLDGTTLAVLEKEEAIRVAKQRILEIENEFNKQKEIRERQYRNDEQNLRVREAGLNAEQDLLTVQSSMSLLTLEELERRRNILEIQNAELGFAKQLQKLTEDRNTKLAEIDKKIDSAKAAKATEEEIEALRNQKTEAESYYKREGELIEKSKEAKMSSIALSQSLTDRMKGYSNIVEGAFEKMGDAIAEFAKTGKLNFKSLIDGMIADLIRFEMQQQMKSMYGAMGGFGGIMSMLGFGSLTPQTGSTAPGGRNFGSDLGFEAQGGVYDGGVRKFAQGGTFTNSIVNSPTLFKFAQGTGLMGEAGPEAIMPLKRDNQGNLGVRTSTPEIKTEVVINNYSGEKATAIETKDSRGNRRVEVVVGDMAAGEISRSGSSSNLSLRNTFGLQQQLIRR